MASLRISLDDDHDVFTVVAKFGRGLEGMIEDDSESDAFFDEYESPKTLRKQFIEEVARSRT